MQTIPAVEHKAQVSSGSEVRPGFEIVRSPNLSRRRFSGPRSGRRPVRFQPELSAHDRVVLLRSQLRLLRLRIEAGLPVSAAAIGRAERLAVSLEIAA